MASLFTKILNGEIKGQIVHQDDLCFAINDIKPEAPTHILIIPKKEIESIATAEPSDEKVLGHMLLVAGKIARDKGLAETGYRVTMNIGEDGGQTVPHLHMHLLGGRPMRWPPG